MQHGPGTLFQVLIMEHQGDGNRERGGNACDTAGTPTHLPSNRKSGALLFLLLPHAHNSLSNDKLNSLTSLFFGFVFVFFQLEDTEGKLLVASEKR